MKSYAQSLMDVARQRRSLVCFGMDPVLERIPRKTDAIGETIRDFYSRIFEEFAQSDVWPSAVKPNYAYFAQYGMEGLMALEAVVQMARPYSLPVILDVKRGDIGPSSAAYAKEAFEFWKADAVTISPYMGGDSVGPFVESARIKGRGVYVLARTSNKGAKDLQELMVEGKPIFRHVAGHIASWGRSCPGTVGAVIGATAPIELADLHEYFMSEGGHTPYLIPGVGAQGGSAVEVLRVLEKPKGHLGQHRINSSSGISYAYEKTGNQDFAKAAVKALRELNREISFT